MRGRFYAVEFPRHEREGLIYLSDHVQDSLKSDLAVVIAVGPEVGLEPGDVVGVRCDFGDWYEDAQFGPYKAEGWVRVYGMAHEFQGESVRVRWDECAPVRIGKDMELRANGTKVVIRRDPVIRSERGLMLPDDVVYRSCLATVVDAGKGAYDEKGIFRVPEVKVGDRVHYQPVGIIECSIEGDPDLAVVDCDAISAVIEEAV